MIVFTAKASSAGHSSINVLSDMGLITLQRSESLNLRQPLAFTRYSKAFDGVADVMLERVNQLPLELQMTNNGITSH
ncbi:hypothetical protein [Pseudomonas mediterranea]